MPSDNPPENPPEPGSPAADDPGPGENRVRRRVDTARSGRRFDRDQSVYARRRNRDQRRRDKLDREGYEPGPPGADDWTVPDRSGLRRLVTGPQPLGDLVEQLLKDRRWTGRMRSAAVFARWDEVVGAELAQHCQPVRLVGGILVVSASSPSWATQLRWLESQLKLAVNRALGEPLVERVEVVVARP